MLYAGTKRLLIVDDVLGTGGIVASLASSLGFDTKIAVCTETFRTAHLAFDPTHVSLDLDIPQGDGVCLLEWIKQQPDPPRILLMSEDAERLAHATEKAGVLGLPLIAVLRKPAFRVVISLALSGEDLGTMRYDKWLLS